MLEIGLTGGIGSGKSTVAALLVERGASLIDADVVVREVQEPGTVVHAAIVQRWGTEVLAADQTLNRRALADRVFGDDVELAALNAIVHPAVADEMFQQRQAFAGTDATVILDIPLLVESGHVGLGGIIVVDVDPEVAVQRLVKFRSFTAGDARARIAQQASRQERLAQADVVIDNSGTLGELVIGVDSAKAWIDALERPPLDQEIKRIGSHSEN
ncbi:MAG: dephospho-CoA kinase [Acidimicrobiales bacterium]|nr:dephospho-CoA kinase [Acidimicrobiales bacterium]